MNSEDTRVDANPFPCVEVTLICERGHQERANAFITSLNISTGEYTFMGGSAWDFCGGDGCSWRSKESRDVGTLSVQKWVKGLIDELSRQQQRNDSISETM